MESMMSHKRRQFFWVVITAGFLIITLIWVAMLVSLLTGHPLAHEVIYPLVWALGGSWVLAVIIWVIEYKQSGWW
jgi:hypothetical protein